MTNKEKLIRLVCVLYNGSNDVIGPIEDLLLEEGKDWEVRIIRNSKVLPATFNTFNNDAEGYWVVGEGLVYSTKEHAENSRRELIHRLLTYSCKRCYRELVKCAKCEGRGWFLCE